MARPLPLKPTSEKPPVLDLQRMEQDMQALLVGQDHAIKQILPAVTMYGAALAPEGRPIANFLLLGPTGTGKTRTIEALAQVLHGSEKHVLRIDCGEFQLEHEVSKIIGAPPGYTGHRETHPAVSMMKLNAVTSERSSISLVLFDEVEKASPNLKRLLLGALDKATLKLGDNTLVSFERSIIFMTSNLGARRVGELLHPSFGFAPNSQLSGCELGESRADLIKRAAMPAVKKHFSPEFLNRLDAVIAYQPLGAAEIQMIFDIEMRRIQDMIQERHGVFGRAFMVDLSEAARAELICRGVTQEFGARELKRVLTKFVLQPLATRVMAGKVQPGSLQVLDFAEGEFGYTPRSLMGVEYLMSRFGARTAEAA